MASPQIWTLGKVTQVLQRDLPVYFRSLLLTMEGWAPVVFLLAYGVRPIILFPSGIFAITAGLVFGTLWGSIYGILGATLGSCTAFLLARHLGRDWVRSRLKHRISAVDRITGEKGFLVILLLRLVPLLPYDVVNYGAGLTNMSFWSYALATLLGVSPSVVLLVYFGRSLADLSLRHLLIGVTGMALLSGLSLWLRRYLRRL